jgi:glycosyltransferase involved in cell wall biosynthesis
MKDTKYNIHATNINGLGAINVANEIINSLMPLNNIQKIYYSKGIKRATTNNKYYFYKRILPNSISRLIEILFSRLFFENIPTLVLGDIPLRGINNQILYVHQANLVKPSINKFSGNNLKFKLLRLLFNFNLKYVKSIIVQTDYMRENLIKSYPKLKCPIKIIPLPPINLKEESIENTIKDDIKLIYPASYYKHKNHDFLHELSEVYKTIKFEIWVTLKKKEFKQYASLPFVKNLGILSHNEVIEKYKTSNGLVNFSNLESFCLPLVEAIYLNLPILTMKRDYSEWMCEESAYYFEDYMSFEKSLKQLIEDIFNNRLESLENPKKKFKLSWNKVAKIIDTLII